MAVNEKMNREGPKHDGAKQSWVAPTVTKRLSRGDLDFQSSFNSFMEPENEGALPV